MNKKYENSKYKDEGNPIFSAKGSIVFLLILFLSINLIGRAQDKINETQLKANWKRKYSEFSQLSTMMQFHTAPLRIDQTDLNTKSESYFNYLDKYLRFKEKGVDVWHQDYEWFTKSGEMTASSYKKFSGKMIDGSILTVDPSGEIIIDINGKISPNTVGKDIFGIWLDKQTAKLYPAGSLNKNWPENTCHSGCSKITQEKAEEDCDKGNGWGCSFIYLFN